MNLGNDLNEFAKAVTKRYKYSTMYYINEGGIIMAFSIRLTEEERQLVNSYATVHAISVGEAFKKALFEKIEDEYDVAIANQAYDEYVNSGKKSKPIQELWNELDLLII